MLLVLDLQEGLYGLARDFDATLYRDSIIAHAAVGKLFGLPVVMSTSAQTGLCHGHGLTLVVRCEGFPD